MSLILRSPEDRRRVIDLVKSISHLLLFPRLTPDDRSQIIQHVEWMSRQTSDPVIHCELETFPEIQETKFVITIRYGAEPISQDYGKEDFYDPPKNY